MRYDLGRFRRPMRRSTEGQLASLVSLGDGSTLSLDFTAMSSLDSRFTFSRSSTATVINSSGLVKYADHNLYYNTGFSGLSGGNPSLTSSGWQYALSTGGTATFNGDGSVTVAASSTRRAISRSAGFAAGSRRVIVSVDITSSGDTGLTPSQLLREGTFSNESYYINSTVWTSGNVVGPCTLSFVYDSGSGNANPYFGVGTASNSTGTVTFANPRVGFFNGVVPAPYLANTSTTAERNDPRFDYDPTTLAPRGLLIEGSATNLLNWSESFATTGGTNNNWADTNITRNSTNNTDPANRTTALRITASAGNGTIISSAAMGTSAERTFSIWLRRVSGTGDIQYTLDNGSTYTTQAITSSWVRYTFASTTAAQRVGIRIVTSGDSIELWGAQLEAGSVASSYIPTGSSTVQRAADVCTLSGTNFSSWFKSTEGTFLATGERAITSNFGRLLSANANNTTSSLDLGASTSGRWLITNTTSQADITAGTVTANTAFKVAGAFANNDAQMAFNGTLGTADTSVSLPTVSQLDIGADRTAVYLNGRIRSIKFWPTRLPDATLQSLTQ